MRNFLDRVSDYIDSSPIGFLCAIVLLLAALFLATWVVVCILAYLGAWALPIIVLVPAGWLVWRCWDD